MRITVNKKFHPYILMVPALVLLIGLRLYPILEVFRLSFTHYLLYEPHNIHFAGFKNFQTAIADEVFRLSLKNTGIWVGLSLVGQFFLGLILAMLLNQKFKFRGIIRAVLFLPWAVSGFLIAVMWRWMYQPQIGIINDLLFRIGIIQQRVAFLARADTALLATVVACIWWGIPFFAIMFLSALQTIPQDLYDAAAVDGASVLRQFRNITVPFLAPVMVTTSLLRAIWIFNFVALIYIMTNGGPYNSSQILSSYIYFTASKALDFGLASAMAVIALLILLVYAIFYLLITRRVREVW